MDHKYSPYRRFAAGIREQSERGFTLIEVLIVVSIIAILATFTFQGVQIAQENARAAQAKSEVANFCQSIDMYYTDEKTYPGRSQKNIDADTNQFPGLYLALLDDPAPGGRGGRNSPYMKMEKDRQAVENDNWDEDEPEGEPRYKKASKKQISDAKVAKYYFDPFRKGQVYIYRCNKGRKPKGWMLNPRGYDLYSVGPDQVDDTILGEDGEDEEDDEYEIDDISNS